MRVGGVEGGGGEGCIPVPEGAVLGTGEEVVGVETVELQFPYCRMEWRLS